MFTANMLIAWSLILGTGGFLVFGILSDHIGRKPIILAGCLVAAVTYFPVFKFMTETANPALHKAQQTVQVVVTADPAQCSFQFNPTGTSRFTSSCDVAKAQLARSSVNYRSEAGAPGSNTTIRIGDQVIQAYSADALTGDAARTVPAAFAKSVGDALIASGYPPAGTAAPGIVKMNHFFDIGSMQVLQLIAVLTFLVLLVTAVYGPIAAALVELFPTRIRYTGMSLPYHIGNGWFGGLLPATSLAMVAQTGDIYFGLWYPIAIALMTLVIGAIFVPENHNKDIFAEEPADKA
jgi:MFS family permease